MGLIYWIASYPKSGNTWVRAFLANLVHASPEPDLNALQAFAPDECNMALYAPFIVKPFKDATLEDFAAVRPIAQAKAAEDANGFLFLKTHHVLGVHAGAPTINLAVTAGALYIVRNPLDVVVSYSAFRGWSLDETIETMATPGSLVPGQLHGPSYAAGSWTQNVMSWTGREHDRIHVLRYEDMLDRPFETFSRLVRFLQMDADETTIRSALARSDLAALQKAEDDHGFVERPRETQRFFRSGRKNEWRDRLSPEQVGTVLAAHAGQMKRFGYYDDAAKFAYGTG